MLDKLRAMISGKAMSLSQILGLPNADTIGDSFDKQCSEGYEINGWVMRCIRMRAETIASIPLVLYKDRTKEEEIESHPLLDLLNNPNPKDSWASLVESLVGFRLLSGNGYLYAVPTVKGPSELYVLNSGATQPNEVRGVVTHYTYNAQDGVKNLLPQDMLHWMCWNPRNANIGLSPLKSAGMSIIQNNEAKRWNAAVLKNGGRTWGVFGTDKDLTEKQYQRLKADMENRYTGPSNAGKPMLLEGGLKWEQMGMNSQDLDWLAGMKVSMREICAILATPSQLLGDAESSTYSNYREAEKAFYRTTIVPDLAGLRDMLNRFLTWRYDKRRQMFLDFNLDDIEALQEDRNLQWARVGTANWITVNEKRAATGYPEIVGGDVLLLPMAMVPQDVNEPFIQDDQGIEDSSNPPKKGGEDEEDIEEEEEPKEDDVTPSGVEA